MLFREREGERGVQRGDEKAFEENGRHRPEGHDRTAAGKEEIRGLEQGGDGGHREDRGRMTGVAINPAHEKQPERNHDHPGQNRK